MDVLSCLRGHKNDVNDLAFGGSHDTLVSASDESVRMWDLDKARTSRCFLPTSAQDSHVDGDELSVNCVTWGYGAFLDVVAFGVGRSFLLFDSREPQLVSKCPKHSFINEHTDEVNHLCFQFDGSLLAAADDSGDIILYDLRMMNIFKKLKRKHSNICTKVLFRPGKPADLISGGLDGQLLHWNINKGKPLNSYDMIEAEATVSIGCQASCTFFISEQNAKYSRVFQPSRF
mmetsp:Transcript_47347/g.125706  ORF Transcript_47347/g.125706 Transcript_47347/m.125706 type:complete len:231 (-) Transcript_47347:26-718(-)